MTAYWKLTCFLAACFSLIAAPAVLWIDQESEMDLSSGPEPAKDTVWRLEDTEEDQKSWASPIW